MSGTRRFKRPNRILARSFRIGRDPWKQKHHAVLAEQAAERTGISRPIVSDHGSDVKQGRARFARQHPATVVTYDAAHHGAIVLQRRLAADARWSEFVARLGSVKARLQQTSDAILLAPSLRPKARYMNLTSLLRGERNILGLLDRGPTGGRAIARAEIRYGWLRTFRAALQTWSRWEATVCASVDFKRTYGLSCSCFDGELSARLHAFPPDQRGDVLAAEFCEFARVKNAVARPGERLVGSTEVLESVFGKWKALERQESRSGITSLILSLGALVEPRADFAPPSRLKATPVKHVVTWCREHLPPSVQSQRRLAFAAPAPANES